MGRFKRKLFGGYKRSDVDLHIWELEKRAEKAEQDVEALQYATENLRRENEQLKSSLAELQTQTANNEETAVEVEEISAESAIGKVYLYAYDTGSKIADTARGGAQLMINRISTSRTDADLKFEGALSRYESAYKQAEEMLNALNNQTSSMREMLLKMNECAGEIPASYENIKAVQLETEKEINAIIENYEKQAGQFLELIGCPLTTEDKKEEKTAE